MKHILSMFLLALLCTLSSAAKDKIQKSFYENGCSEVFQLTEDGLTATKIVEFPGKTKDELTQLVAQYLRNRIESDPNHREPIYPSTDSNNAVFSDGNLAIKEESYGFKDKHGGKVWTTYSYRIAIKGGKVKLNIITLLHENDYGTKWHASKCYPFTKKYKKAISVGYKAYITELFEDFERQISILESGELDNW